MTHYGYSTGAIAKDDIDTALACLRSTRSRAVEFSALRLHELRGVLDNVLRRDTSDFQYRSFHVPSRFTPDDEAHVLEAIRPVIRAGWPVIVHPDVIYRPERWQWLGALLLIENMDRRKPIGRDADELEPLFASLPEAGLCFDLAHARQVDSTMTEAYRIIHRFGDRIRQIHLSDVDDRSAHQMLTIPALNAFIKVIPFIRTQPAVILEAPVPSCREVPEQVMMARLLFAAAAVRQVHRSGKAQNQCIHRSTRDAGLAVHGEPLCAQANDLELTDVLRDLSQQWNTPDRESYWHYLRQTFFTTAGISGPLIAEAEAYRTQ